MSAKKLYLFTTIALLLGYLWIGFHMFKAQQESEKVYHTCLIKATTGYPCPSCGSSRAIISLVNGNFKEAISINPFGVLMAFLMIILPFWMLYDVVVKQKSYWKAYQKMEALFKLKPILILFIIVVIANWIWNIYKGL